jgi:hypothetical protein
MENNSYTMQLSLLRQNLIKIVTFFHFFFKLKKIKITTSHWFQLEKHSFKLNRGFIVFPFQF